jgi:hypothetical protein
MIKQSILSIFLCCNMLHPFMSEKNYKKASQFLKGQCLSPVLRARPGNFLGGIRGRHADHGSRAGRRRGGTRRQRRGGRRPRSQRRGGPGRRGRRRGGNGRGGGSGRRGTRGRGGWRRWGRNFYRGGCGGLFLRSGWSCPTASTSHLQTVQYINTVTNLFPRMRCHLFPR